LSVAGLVLVLLQAICETSDVYTDAAEQVHVVCDGADVAIGDDGAAVVTVAVEPMK